MVGVYGMGFGVRDWCFLMIVVHKRAILGIGMDRTDGVILENGCF